MNALDRLVGYVAPERAAARVAARARIAAVEQATAIYEGAARSQRFAFRSVQSTSANSEIWQSLWRLRDVHRDMVRNNPYAANIVSAIPANVVGAGIIPTIITDAKRLKKNLQALVADHLDTPAIDFDGRLNLYGIQNLVMRCVAESGEALVVRYVPPARLKLPVPLQVRVLEPDFLDSAKHGAIAGGNMCFQGIEFDSNGRRAAYWLYDEHPGGLGYAIPQSKRVPADDVIHVYRVDRPGQARGVPWGAPVVATSWDLHDYEDAELMRQKIAACFAVFYTGGDAPGLPAAAAAGGQTTFVQTPIETVEPGMIKRLPQGADVKFATPPTTQGYDAYVRAGARKIAVGWGVPYEIATGDMSQVSFISGRMGVLQFNRNVDQWRWLMLIPHLCATIGKWFLQASTVPLAGPVGGARLDWTPPRREMVSPKDEVPPIKEAIRSGLTSRSEELRKQGYDPEVIEQEQADENARADALHLRFDSDGRFPLNMRGSEIVPPEPGTGETPVTPAAPGAVPTTPKT